MYPTPKVGCFVAVIVYSAEIDSGSEGGHASDSPISGGGRAAGPALIIEGRFAPDRALVATIVEIFPIRTRLQDCCYPSAKWRDFGYTPLHTGKGMITLRIFVGRGFEHQSITRETNLARVGNDWFRWNQFIFPSRDLKAIEVRSSPPWPHVFSRPISS